MGDIMSDETKRGDDVWPKSKPVEPDEGVDRYRVPQGPDSGIAAIIGKWPGEETDDEIASAEAWDRSTDKATTSSDVPKTVPDLVPNKIIRKLEKSLGWSVEVAFEKRPENTVRAGTFPLIARIISNEHEPIWFPICRRCRSDFTILSELDKAETIPDWLQVMYLERLVFTLKSEQKQERCE